MSKLCHAVLLWLSGLYSMRVYQSDIGFYSHILEDFVENSLFFILFSQLSPFPGRDMSPEGAELAIKTSSNTTTYLVSAFPSEA